MTDKLREAALWKLLTEARETLWQPANPDLCGRIDEALAQQDAPSALCQRCVPVCRGGAGCFAGMPDTDPSKMTVVKVVSPAQQDAQNAADEVWRKLFWQAALKLKCLPSSYPDANGHVLRAIDRLMGSENAQQDAQAVVQEPCAVVKWQTGGPVVHIIGDVQAGDLLYRAAPTPPAQQDAREEPK